MTTPSVELPTIPNDGDGDDDYMNAVMGRDTYPNGIDSTHEQSPNDEVTAGAGSKLSKPNVQSGIAGASANLINSIVGAGIIGIPYALKQSGLIAGVFLLILVAYLTDKSLRIIVGLASFHPLLKNLDIRSFEELASYPFGHAGYNFILVNMFILAYGAMVAYLLIIKDTVPTILGVDEEASWARVGIMFVTSITIMVPLAMQRDMASLAITSVFSVLADVILVVFIASFAPMKETIAEEGGFGQVLLTDGINSTLFIGLGILSTAMACQHSAFIVSGSLKDKTMKRWSTVTGFSITTSAILCAILGVCGYLGFLEKTQGDVLNNFNPDSFTANAARSLLAVTMFCTYPMESFVARHVLVMLFHGGDMDGKDDPSHNGQEGYEAGGYLCLNRRQTWTVAIYIMTLIPAVIFTDLGPVLSITGSLGGGCISYIAPGLVYLGVNGDAFLSFAYSLVGNTAIQTDERGVTTSDLPIEGDADQRMGGVGGAQEIPVSGFRLKMSASDEPATKPLWWYVSMMPLWCAIASHGRFNMQGKLREVGATPQNSNSPNNPYTDDEREMLPSRSEFCIAIFFVIFGIISAVLGVTSNIWEQINAKDEGYYNE